MHMHHYTADVVCGLHGITGMTTNELKAVSQDRDSSNYSNIISSSNKHN